MIHFKFFRSVQRLIFQIIRIVILHASDFYHHYRASISFSIVLVVLYSPTPIQVNAEDALVSWSQIGQQIIGKNNGSDRLGSSISLSSDGKRVAIGAPHFGTGYVTIRDFISGSWVNVGNDIVGDAESTEFGITAGLSNNGNRVVIQFQDYLKQWNFRVYELQSNNDWVHIGGDIPGPGAIDWFDNASLSDDGSRVVIGMRYGSNDRGKAQVFDYVSDEWEQIGQDIVGDDHDRLGGNVSITPDGNRIVVGADNGDGSEPYSGYVKILEFKSNSWVQLGHNIGGEASGDQFGLSISVSDDGNRVAIGAPNNDGNGTAAGHVRIFEYDGSDWKQLGADIDGDSVPYNFFFGMSVSLSSNGNRVAIGAHAAKIVRVFDFVSRSWTQVGDEIHTEWDLFGVSNKLSSDGDRVAVGSFGAAIIYESGPQYVLIKSVRNDKCLQGDSLDFGALVGFRACNSNEFAQHWRFDSKGRFRNRKNKRRCLARNKLKQIGIAGCNVAKRKKFIYKKKNEKIVMAVNPKKAWKAMSTRVTVTFRANVKAQKWLLVRV